MLRSSRPFRKDINQTEWGTYANIELMYDVIYKQMEKTGLLRNFQNLFGWIRAAICATKREPTERKQHTGCYTQSPKAHSSSRQNGLQQQHGE